MPKAWTDLNGTKIRRGTFFSWESPFWWNCDLYCLKTKLFSGHFMITFSELYNPTPWWYLIYIQIGVFSYEHFHIHECISISSTSIFHTVHLLCTQTIHTQEFISVTCHVPIPWRCEIQRGTLTTVKDSTQYLSGEILFMTEPTLSVFDVCLISIEVHEPENW